MKKFINYLAQLKEQKILTKNQLYLSTFGILFFLGLLITLPIITGNRQEIKTQTNISKATADTATVVQEITTEALKPNTDPSDWPLPLAGVWDGGLYQYTSSYQGGTFTTPDYQVSLIQQGHHLLPTFELPAPPPISWQIIPPDSYFTNAIAQIKAWGLPITLKGSQFERILSEHNEFWSMPFSTNPNVWNKGGFLEKKMSPFGLTSSWSDAGRQWATTQTMANLQQWYPNPPKVVFLSNNEHPRLWWNEAENEQRWLNTYGTGQTDDFKRKTLGDAWISLFPALQQGWRNALTAPAWKNNSTFVGYYVGTLTNMGSYSGWEGDENSGVYSSNRLDPWHSAWDGISGEYYIKPGSAFNYQNDYTAGSLQTGWMNNVALFNEEYKEKPNEWYEVSVWDGWNNCTTADCNKRIWYQSLGQTYNAARYKGWVQFQMWLARPRVVREFREWDQSQEQIGTAYFQGILDSVDSIYNDTNLKRFWRQGQLVANTAHPHPYQINIPSQLSNVNRWFQLDTNLDPARPWSLTTELPVFALARTIGSAPNREWLVYAFSPRQDRTNVQITIPGYQTITMDVAQGGSFKYISEAGGTTSPTPPSPTPVGPSLSVSPTSVSPGSSVTASWNGVSSPTVTDWIGVYVPGAADSAYNPTSWRYTSSCTQTAGSTAKTSGSCSITMPSTTGTFELRLYSNDGYTRLATSSMISVVNGGSTTPTPTPTTPISPTPTSTLDTTKPTVAITSPSNGSTVSRRSNVTISATASDNVGVTKVEFIVNNTLKFTDTASPYSYTWSVPNTKNVQYTLTAKAYDAIGNSSQASISVTSN